MKISNAANAVEPSLTRKLFNMAKAYDDVIDLTLGDPDIVPSEKIRVAACEAIMAGKTRYSANAGMAPLREAIAENFKSEYGLDIDALNQVVVTVGGMEALYLSLACMINPGDEVIILAPYYVNYKQMVSMCSGVPVIVNTKEEDGFSVSVEMLEKVITDRTVAIIINTPCNPTGSVLDLTSLEAIAQLAEKHDIAVISDEVYRSLIYDNAEHQSIAKLPGMLERTVIIDSFSKRFSMTGYRVGYAIAPADFAAAMIKLQENVAACTALPSQYAAIAAFENCREDTFIKDEFQKRRDYIYNAINNIKGLSCIKPKATFYLFVNIKETGLDALTFAYKLLESEHVAVVPGIAYGEEYTGYIRIAYTMKIEILEEAVSKINKFVSSLNK
ncbi:MAG: pyridoxal phosphate-dependent aminotransferase [Clostridia bacterium]|nr:pyridoxal phosphate-dependent aminotransferase [Clostridia bacterium]MBQ7289137.1 pyridoxal phosphate-dependent aminotransferase [Clostridia bacterium]